jgi:hypothetical protein
MSEQDIKTHACALKHALCIGLVELRLVVTWAEALIRGSDNVADWLADLALSQSTNQAMSFLTNVPGESTAELWWPLLKQQIATALESGITEPQAVATYCYNLALSGDIPAYDCEALYQFELEYDSIFSGYGTQAEVDIQVRRFFNKLDVTC